MGFQPRDRTENTPVVVEFGVRTCTLGKVIAWCRSGVSQNDLTCPSPRNAFGTTHHGQTEGRHSHFWAFLPFWPLPAFCPLGLPFLLGGLWWPFSPLWPFWPLCIGYSLGTMCLLGSYFVFLKRICNKTIKSQWPVILHSMKKNRGKMLTTHLHRHYPSLRRH